MDALLVCARLTTPVGTLPMEAIIRLIGILLITLWFYSLWILMALSSPRRSFRVTGPHLTAGGVILFLILSAGAFLCLNLIETAY